jgi:hypothetical protein
MSIRDREDIEAIIRRVASLPEVIGQSLDQFGGYLRCETCHAERAMRPGMAGRFTARGWPKCCGHTMRWWTQSQIDAGEMPA